ncbi:sorting nexin-6-like [Halichondria panicea]|uniref:sorting nexin-6-like n=1 Tax=Halichondria panicea TaxID=6063 RepID=UPI00312B60CB
MDDLFDNSPFSKQEEPAETQSDPPASLDVEQDDVSFGFPPTGADAIPGNSAPLKYNAQADTTADDDDDDGPAASEPTTPHDDIKVSVKSYEATADDFIFNVEVEVNGQTKTVQRSYKDLQWLHRNLSRKMELGGYILPPLPAPPPSVKSVDPKMVILGDDSQAMFGDVTRLPCIEVEQFMQTLADHRFFSENDTVHTYVANHEVSERDKLGTGTLWNAFTGIVSEFQLSKIEDTEEDFHRFLEYVTDLAPLLKECAQNHSKLVSSKNSLACSQVFIAGMLKEHSTFETFRNKVCSSTFQRLGEGLDEEKQSLHSKSLDSRHTIGMTFDLYHRYSLQAKEMLYRRLSKLQKLLTCTSKLGKAKPEKKAEAEDAREAAQKDLQDITETARKEIELFKQKYAEFFGSNMIGYVESQLAHSKRAHENLTAIRDQLLEGN